MYRFEVYLENLVIAKSVLHNNFMDDTMDSLLTQKKREGSLSVTRPAFRGSGMPFTIERATQSLTPTCI